jgi:murein DD-endopeptidase MepM/ murein hydrolase activator NlpD
MASFPRAAVPSGGHEWQALGIAPLAGGAATGARMVASELVQPIEYVPERRIPLRVAEAAPKPIAPRPPQRIRGRVGQRLYWSLRASGASPDVAARYLAALATATDVGEVAAGDGFDMVLGPGQNVLYAGLDRVAGSDLQLVHWTQGGSRWIDAAAPDQPSLIARGSAWPVAGRITSHFGYRRHPILGYSRLHAGMDFGAGWGTPIVAAADGQVVRAGWAGGYGRQVRIVHGDGLLTSYSHMSSITAEPGTLVRAGQLIGYVGSSGLSTGPHLHYEVRRYGTPVNPLSVRFGSVQMVDNGVGKAVRARLKVLLGVGVKRG